jgi:GNAT superfamily N-acetyltransferase
VTTIRAAGPDDLLAVLGVHARHDPGGQIPTSATDRERQTWDRMTASPDLTVYLAEVDGTSVGTASLMTMPNVTYDCAPTAFVEAVVVAVEFRRRGIATALMTALLEDAARVGCNKVQLLSHKRHATDGAHGLYLNLGFESEAEGFRLYLGHKPNFLDTPVGGAG